MSRDVVPLGSAFPSPLLFPLPRLARAMASSVQKLDPWASVDDLTPGNASLRRQIALRYLVDGVHVPTDEIVVTNGAMEALNLCLLAVTRPGRCGAGRVARASTPRCRRWNATASRRSRCRPIRATASTWRRWRRAIERHAPKACWLMTNFQNPLGSSMPDDKKRDLVALLGRHDVPLIEDDVYGELYFGGKRPGSAKRFDSKGLVMHCSSFSKCLAPGYRVGWAAPGRLRASGGAAQADHAPCRPRRRRRQRWRPTWSGAATNATCASCARRWRSSRPASSQAMAEHFPAGSRATRPAGGYFVWVELPAQRRCAGAAPASAGAVASASRPGPIFSAHRGFRNCLRLNYGHAQDERTRQALATLGQLIAEAARLTAARAGRGGTGRVE